MIKLPHMQESHFLTDSSVEGAGDPVKDIAKGSFPFRKPNGESMLSPEWVKLPNK